MQHEHSPLGGSSMERVIKCPGSARLGYGVADDESDYAAVGTAAHWIAEQCLLQKQEAWQWIGYTDGMVVDKEMADAVQTYLDAINEWHPERDQSNSWVERGFHCPSFHKYYWGKSDFVYLSVPDKALHVWDYKHGAGIIVEAEESVQGRYYAAGIMDALELWGAQGETFLDRIVIHIMQPRGWHWEGPHRIWETTPDELYEWLWGDLVPAMNLALLSTRTQSGDHCRFCPARYRACPQLVADMTELEELVKEFEGKEAPAIGNEQIGRFLSLLEVAKIAGKAWSKVGYSRIANGEGVVPGWKVVASRSNRQFKEGAEEAAVKAFGKKRAFTVPQLKSPAQIDEMPKGKDFTATWAFKPDSGYTLAPEKDARRQVSKDTKSLFSDQSKKGKSA